MKKGFHKLEHFVDKSIPYIVFILFFIIIITLFFKELEETYHFWIQIADILIIVVFSIDLIFKFIRVRKIKKFVKTYWLDILAVFPFYLFIRFIEEIYLVFRISDTLQEGQTFLHAWLEIIPKEASLLEKETGKIIRETEKFGKISRSGFIARFIRPAARIPRLTKVIPYYEKTTGHHHAHDPK